jgi:hypothetical protein
MIVAILAQDLNANSNGRFVLGLGSQVKRKRCRDHTTTRIPRLIVLGAVIKLRGELGSAQPKPTAGVGRASGRASH